MRKSSDETNRLSSSLTFNSFFSHQSCFLHSRDREQINWNEKIPWDNLDSTLFLLLLLPCFLADELLMRKVFRRDFSLIVVLHISFRPTFDTWRMEWWVSDGPRRPPSFWWINLSLDGDFTRNYRLAKFTADACYYHQFL